MIAFCYQVDLALLIRARAGCFHLNVGAPAGGATYRVGSAIYMKADRRGRDAYTHIAPVVVDTGAVGRPRVGAGCRRLRRAIAELDGGDLSQAIGGDAVDGHEVGQSHVERSPRAIEIPKLEGAVVVANTVAIRTGGGAEVEVRRRIAIGAASREDSVAEDAQAVDAKGAVLDLRDVADVDRRGNVGAGRVGGGGGPGHCNEGGERAADDDAECD